MNSVYRLVVALLVTATIATATAHAQDKPTGDKTQQVLPERETLIPERIAFCKKFYQLNKDEAEKLRMALEAKVLLHREYMSQHQTDLRRLTATIAVALPQQDPKQYTPEQKERFRAYYQDQIYRIHENAPMSLSYTVQQAEAIVGDGRAKTGRGEVAKFFKPVLGDDALELSRVDRLVLKPVAMEDVSMTDNLVTAQAKLLGGDAPQSTEKPSRKPAPKAADDRAAKKESMAKPPVKNPAPPVVPDNLRNQPLFNAPAVGEWEATYQTWCNNYEFNQEQKKTAAQIYEYTHRKALEYISENKDKIESGTEDGQGQSKARMQPVLALFNQMKTRIDNVATLEQRARWAQKQKDSDDKE